MFVIVENCFYICKQIVNIMNSRLQQFLSAENISQSQFADTIGVARASVSHIIAGRNRPGYDFILSMARSFPTLNLEWLITGKGRMYKGDSEPSQPAPAIQGAPAQESLFAESEIEKEAPVFERTASSKPSQKSVKQRSISKIIVFYDDNSFEELR